MSLVLVSNRAFAGSLRVVGDDRVGSRGMSEPLDPVRGLRAPATAERAS